MDRILDRHRHETEQPTPEAILGSFPGFFIQYFDDSGRDPSKAFSTPHFHRPEADARQRQGCGVYFAPNAFVGARRRECLVRIQAVFLDIDCGKEGDGRAPETLERRKADALLRLLGSPRPPHAITETKHGLQPVWRLRPLAVEEGLRLFREAMDVLLRRFDGDPSAMDPVRCLRMPGYFHLKNPAEPFRCLLLWNELEREPEDVRAIVDDLYLPPVRSSGGTTPIVPPAPRPFEPDLEDVICAAAREAGLTVTFRRNRDGSRQIVEDGEVTSGFISARGNFCHSSSGKPRRGGPLQLVQYYLGLDRTGAQRWLADRFGSSKSEGRSPQRSQRELDGAPASPGPPVAAVTNPPIRLARGDPRGIDVPATLPSRS